MNNQYPRETEEDELDSVDFQSIGRLRRNSLPLKLLVIGNPTMRSEAIKAFIHSKNAVHVGYAKREDVQRECVFIESTNETFIPAHMDFGPKEARLNNEFLKVFENIRKSEERLQRAYENFAAQWGRTEMQRVKDACKKLNLNFYTVADFYAQVKASEIQERDRREELRAAVAQLATVVPPTNKRSRENYDNIPVPKGYRRNRFKP